MGLIPPILFWPVAASLAAICVVLVIWFAARAAKAAPLAAEDPARAVYRRQLGDLDELVDRGLLAEDERSAARAEAARRLLAHETTSPEQAGARWWPFAAAGAAAFGALVLYLVVGSPGTPDQPYRARLRQWSSTPPQSLPAGEFAAVVRDAFGRKPPSDPRLWGVLAQAEVAAGDPMSALQHLKRALALSPNDPGLNVELGLVLTKAAGDKPSPEGEAAFRKALEIDPKNQSALYYLGGARAAAGDRSGAAELWRRLAAELPDKDERKAALLAAVDRMEKGTPPPVADNSVDASGQGEMIRGMVAKQKATLDANPNDPAGWARLVRSYHVLGDKAAEAAALAKARALFKDRPGDLAPIEAAAK
jgi:cytochrome c-type biogenesis protein CcmH